MQLIPTISATSVCDSPGAGIVEVTENNSDRRSFHIRLTRMGAGKLEAARKDIAVFREKLSQKYSPETIRMLNEFADRLA